MLPINSLFTLVTIALLCVTTLACGDASVRSGLGSQASRRVATLKGAETGDPKARHILDNGVDYDEDSDSGGYGYFDWDDNASRYYGHAAGAQDAHAMTRLVKRYFTAARGQDGATACSLVDASVVAGLVGAVSHSSRQSSARRAECAGALTQLFKQSAGREADEMAQAFVTVVRAQGDRGLVLLRLPNLEPRFVLLERERGAWKLDTLFEGRLR